MRILVLADIHANWAALSTIDEKFDACLFVGDAVDYGTAPKECLNWLRENKAICVRGNHDHAVAQRIQPRPGTGFRQLTAATRPVNWRVLDDEDLTHLARYPVTRQVSIGDHTLYLLHATPRDPLDEYLTDDPEAWQQRLGNVQADFICTGHTHIPMHLGAMGETVRDVLAHGGPASAWLTNDPASGGSHRNGSAKKL